MLGQRCAAGLFVTFFLLIFIQLSADRAQADTGSLDNDCGSILSAIASLDSSDEEESAEADPEAQNCDSRERLPAFKETFLKADDLVLKVRLLNHIGLSGDMAYAAKLFTFVEDNNKDPDGEEPGGYKRELEREEVLRDNVNLELLASYLRDADPAMREHASALLRDVYEHGRSGFSAEILAIAADRSAPGRVEAIEALSASPVAAYQYRIFRFTSDPSTEVRAAAVRALCYRRYGGRSGDCLKASENAGGLRPDASFPEKKGAVLYETARILKKKYYINARRNEITLLIAKKDEVSSRKLTEAISTEGVDWDILNELADRAYAPAFAAVAKLLPAKRQNDAALIMKTLVALDRKRGLAEIRKYRSDGSVKEEVADALAAAGKTEEAAELYLECRVDNHRADIDEKLSKLGEAAEKPLKEAVRAGRIPFMAFAGFGFKDAAEVLWEIYGSSDGYKTDGGMLAALLSLKEERAKAPAIQLLTSPDSGFHPGLAEALASCASGDDEAAEAVFENIKRAEVDYSGDEKDSAFSAAAALHDPKYHDRVAEAFHEMATVESCEGKYRDWDRWGIGECKDAREEVFRNAASYFAVEGSTLSYEPVEELLNEGLDVHSQFAQALNSNPGRPFRKFSEHYSDCGDDECRKKFISAAKELKSVDLARFLKAAHGVGSPEVKEAVRSEWEEAGKAIIGIVPAQLNDKDPEVRAEAAWALGAVTQPLPREGLDVRGWADGMMRFSLAMIYAIGGITAPLPPGPGGLDAAAKALAEALLDADPRVRANAAQAAGLINDERVKAGLPALLDDKDQEVRLQAVTALGLTGYRAVIPRVGELLKDASPVVRIAAAEALCAMRDKRAAPYLNAALQDKNHGVYLAVLSALVSSGDASSVKPLSDALALRSRDPAAAKPAIEALSAIGDELAAQALYAAADRGNLDALAALGRIKSPGSVALLLRRKDDKDPAVRRTVAEALGNISSFGVTGPLVDFTSDPEREVIHAAVYGLGGADIEKDAALPVLLRLAGSEDAEVAGGAAIALGSLRDARAVEPLLNAVKNGADPYTFIGALGSIGDKRVLLPLLSEKADGEKALAVLRAIPNLSGPDEQTCRYALLALYMEDSATRTAALSAAEKVCKGISLRGDDTLPSNPADMVYIETLDRGDDVSEQAVLSLAVLGDSRALEELRHMHNTSEGMQKVAAVRALGKFGGSAIPILAEDLASGDFYVADEASGQLAEIGGKEAAEALLTAVRYVRNDMRVIFLNRLSHLKYAPAYDTYSGLLESGNVKEQVASAFALGELGDPRALELLKKAGAGGDERLKEAAMAAVSEIEKVPAGVR